MQNRFGLKDLVLMLLMILVIVMQFLSIRASDREYGERQKTDTALTDSNAVVATTMQRFNASVNELSTEIDEFSTVVDEALRQNNQQITEALNTLSGRIDAVIASGVRASDPSNGSSGSGFDISGGPGVSRANVDTSWARDDGTPITFSKPWTYTNSPLDDPGYRAGGEFVEIFEGQPRKITPYRFSDVYGRRVNDVILESLGWYDPVELTVRGRLAEAWQYADDGMWLRVKIRDEAVFSDGTPVEAHDVAFTFHDVIFNPQIEADRDRSVYYNIDRVTPISDKVVEFTFKTTNSDNLEQALGFRIMPEHYYSDFIASPITYNQSNGLVMGSGPFRLKSLDPNNQWAPGEDIRLVRNENYWGPTPPVDKLRFTVISDGQARITAYSNGQGDMMRPSAEQIMRKREDPAFQEKNDERVWYNMRGGYAFIAWQTGEKPDGTSTPFSDRLVRLAMTHMIDRERIIRDISYGLARPRTGPFSTTSPQSNSDVEPWPYDMDRARELLAEAGWVDVDGDNVLEKDNEEFEFTFTYSNGQESTTRIVNYIGEQCAALGIRMKKNPIDWAIMTTKLNTRDFDCITLAWSASKPESDPNQLWHSDSIEGQGDNFTQWSNPEADRLIDLGSRTVDFDERMEIWHQLHELIHEEQPYTFLMELPWRRFTTKQTKNFNEYNSGIEYYEFWKAPSGMGETLTP